ncbi:hypothetical protein BGZ94_009784 [Podila epigama]|nr:hypothetical protein BGZ94_009784 [Podila epigama]
MTQVNASYKHTSNHWRHTPLACLLLLASILASLSSVTASITCALPAGSSYKAGDSIILDWGSDGTMPVVTDIASINGTLFCNTGNVKIADVSIPNLTGPFSWTVPSVGNATTVGGTVGVCPMNAFHMEYSGEAWGFLHLVKSPWGPVRCGTITIIPAENGTVVTTTTMAPTSTTITTTLTPTSTSDPNENKSSGISTVVIVVIAVVAAVLLTLAVVGLVWYLRKQKKRRLANALGPWSLSSTSNSNNMNHHNNNNNNNNMNVVAHHHRHNQFSKIPTLDHDEDDHDAVGGGGLSNHGSPLSSGRPAMAALAAGMGASSYAMKSQPALPGKMNNNSTSKMNDMNQGYYSDDGDFANYGYHQQRQQLLNQGGYNNQGYHLPGQGYTDNSNNIRTEDDYYNPYYANQQQQLEQQQQYHYQNQHQGMNMNMNMGMGMNYSNPSFHNNVGGAGAGTPGSTSLGMQPHRPFVHEHAMAYSHPGSPDPLQNNQGYFPPPPVAVPLNGSSTSLAFGGGGGGGGGPGPGQREVVGSVLTSLPTGSSVSSSPKRGPQGTIVMAEMGRREAEDELAVGVNEKVLVKEDDEKESDDKPEPPQRQESTRALISK